MKLPFLRKKKKKKSRKRAFLKKEKYIDFLGQVKYALKDLFKTYPEREALIKEMKKQTNLWLNDLESIDTSSFKAGVCFGVLAFMQILQEERERKESYVV